MHAGYARMAACVDGCRSRGDEGESASRERCIDAGTREARRRGAPCARVCGGAREACLMRCRCMVRGGPPFSSVAVVAQTEI